jgi:hypothetical protein
MHAVARIMLDVAALSDTGRCRTYNEDAFRITDLGRRTSLRPPSACAASGLGAARAGTAASRRR